MRQIHDAPPVFVIDNFLSSSDVQELVEAFKDPSVGLSMKSPQFSSAVSTRTSSTKFLPYDYPVVARFLSAAMDLLNAPMCNFEEPQVVRYKIGQEFTEHYDFVPPSSDKDVTQRAATLLVYLSSVSGSSGGATTFRDLGISVQPRVGKALLFFPSFVDGSNDERTLHKAEKITRGEKFIAQIWLHRGKYVSKMFQQ